jgi:hypothetical protein
LLPDRREVKVPAMSLTERKNLSNPISGLFGSALILWFCAEDAKQEKVFK